VRVRLPHVMLAYRMRQKDVGSAPVSGDVIRYIVTDNGQADKVWAKAESLEVR
jgi:DNA polymerase elongation subunit (family B)